MAAKRIPASMNFDWSTQSETPKQWLSRRLRWNQPLLGTWIDPERFNRIKQVISWEKKRRKGSCFPLQRFYRAYEVIAITREHLRRRSNWCAEWLSSRQIEFLKRKITTLQCSTCHTSFCEIRIVSAGNVQLHLGRRCHSGELKFGNLITWFSGTCFWESPHHVQLGVAFLYYFTRSKHRYT